MQFIKQLNIYLYRIVAETFRVFGKIVLITFILVFNLGRLACANSQLIPAIIPPMGIMHLLNILYLQVYRIVN